LLRDELPLHPQVCLQPFEKWAIDFVGPIHLLGKKTSTHYIITTMGYLTRWAEEKSVKDCTGDMTTMFLYGYVLTRFGCSKVLVSDKAMHFLNEMISALTEEFQVYHQKSTPYHRQENRTIEAFNKILENALMKICNVQWNEWNVHVPAILWAYKTTCKKMIGKTPFKLVDGVEAVIPMEYIVPRLCIKSFMNMEDLEPLEEWIA